MQQRFLVIQTAFIGDVVLATALLEKLHQHYPDVPVDFLLRKGNDGLLAGHPFLNQLHVWDKRAGKYRDLFRIIKAVRRAKYTHVINVHRFAASGLVTLLSGAAFKSGFDKNPLAWCYTEKHPHRISTPDDALFIHETDRNQSLIASFTDASPARPRLYPAAADYELVAPYKGDPFICIAPSSVWFTKRYPPERWVELIDALPADHHIYLLGGPEDAPLCESILAAAGRQNIFHLCGRLSLMQSAALMQDAAMNYTNDSGPLHFATAVNAPVTAVYCSTHPCFGFGPLSDVRKVVQVAGLYCKPCGLHGYAACPEGHFRCAKDIPTTALL